VSKKRVERLMKKAGIHAVTKKKYRATTDSKHSHPIAANYLNRNFKVDKPNKFWVADITYIFTQEGWLYLSTIMDLYSRKILILETGNTIIFGYMSCSPSYFLILWILIFYGKDHMHDQLF